jgi:hypothetical protein
MKRTTIFLAITVALSVAAIQGCGDDTDPATTTTTTATTGTATTTGTGGSGGTGGTNVVPPPAIGAQIDRFGRPAINTALNKTFSADTAAKDAAKDAWNKDDDAANWSMTFGAEVAGNLAILDAVDTICGNQPLAAPEPIMPNRYAGLAGALADDRLWVNTAGAACTIYLAVEADAALGVENADCGGRTLGYDVVDQSYSILAAGDLSGSVGDGIEPDADTAGEVFPYLADPH